MSAATGNTPTAGRYLAAGVGMLLLVLGVLPYISAGLIAPPWAMLMLMSVWFALFLYGCFAFRSHPFRVLVLPVIALVIWLLTMYVGGTFLDWTP